ncbi:LutB/LldF family L-lactate oxidation iron-sulfur protein [Candidatus Albibeggiatoa sp. nov. BB20]|uniref:LutB/LldF family L-lactate oxidation iron-sulfur protein n=1 Tax=Candidatus Albibeggiatoa sp. nov. BB20 TaxID=3162723 RepID=UPI00336585E5
MKIKSQQFKKQASRALDDENLQAALQRAKSGFIDKRRKALDALPEFEQLRDTAKGIKEHSLSYLDFYLSEFEKQVEKQNGHVHWASDAKTACEQIVDICQRADAKKIIKGKSMVGEEIALNEALEAAKFQVVETDLGEYIIQLAEEPPSHIIAPAVHKTRKEISDLFYKHHQQHGFEKLDKVSELVDSARQVLRNDFVSADVGITGANFLIAETGSIVLVTNEGNGDLASHLPRVHIVVTSIEKVIPSLEDANVFLRLLARSATGQTLSTYTSFITGAKREADLDGANEFHVVLLDNGRSSVLGSSHEDMLHCIRCGACMNHCPVYSNVGGHAYGWVYPGPMGSVLTPLLCSIEEASSLPNASTLCGRCEEVCPMKIPLPKLLREHRFNEFDKKLQPKMQSWALKLWGYMATHPSMYRFMVNKKIRILKLLSRNGWLKRAPMSKAWTQSRDILAPEGQSFISQYQKRNSS